MITSTKNYKKKKKKKPTKKTDIQNPRTNGKTKLNRQNHTQKHTHTHSQKEKKEKIIYISLLPKSTSLVWDDSLSIQVFHRCRVYQVDCGDLIRCS